MDGSDLSRVALRKAAIGVDHEEGGRPLTHVGRQMLPPGLDVETMVRVVGRARSGDDVVDVSVETPLSTSTKFSSLPFPKKRFVCLLFVC